MGEFWKRRPFALLLLVFLFVQVALVSFLDSRQVSDARTYIELAHASMQAGSLYPTAADKFSNFIFAPGYINYLIGMFTLFGDNVRAVLYVNIILNVTLLLEVVFIAKALFGERVAGITAIGFCLYLTNYGVVMYTYTELLYCVLAYGALALFLRRGGGKSFALAGVMIVLANWVRPLAIVFIAAMFLIAFLHKIGWRKVGLFLSGAAATFLLIGTVTYSNLGTFNTTSTTSGYNLLMGADDTADGRFNANVFKDGATGDIPNRENLTFAERDRYWKDHAIEWIKQHPLDYALLIPKKLYYMYYKDAQFIASLTGNRTNQDLEGKGMVTKFLFYATQGYNQLFYLFLLSMAAYGSVKLLLRRDVRACILLAVVVLGTGMTIITVGEQRYHYPYLMVLLILAAYSVQSLIDARGAKHSQEVSVNVDANQS